MEQREFHGILPYASVLGGFVLAFFTLLKEWKEYRHRRWLKRAVLIVLCVTCLASVAALYRDNEEKSGLEQEVIALGTRISGLQGQVESSEKAQANNTGQFIVLFKNLSKEVGALQTQVATAALQKKLASLQVEIQNTQKELAPPPKAVLLFSFSPFRSPPAESGLPTVPSVSTTLAVKDDGSVHVNFTVLNLTNADALDGEIKLFICDQCTFAKEPAGFFKVANEPDNVRHMAFQKLYGQSSATVMSVDVLAPPQASNFPMGIQYRCRTCVVDRGVSKGMVYLKR